jgi:hypothetical protein
METHSRQACDGCRFRKTKCDRQSPCNTCTKASLTCQYRHVIQQRGPRKGQGRRLARLRAGPSCAGEDVFTVSTLSTYSKSGSDGSLPCVNPVKSMAPPSTASKGTYDLPTENLVEQSAVLAAHVCIFVKHMFPIMPVINTAEILSDVLRLDELSPSRYALILSICAATRMQFSLDTMPNSRWGADIPQEPKVSTEMLLKAVEDTRRPLNLVDDVSLDAVATSYFLFTVYASMEKLRHAWLYLNQSITLASLLGIDDETGHFVLSDHDSVVGRRMFWILFVTER